MKSFSERKVSKYFNLHVSFFLKYKSANCEIVSELRKLKWLIKLRNPEQEQKMRQDYKVV